MNVPSCLYLLLSVLSMPPGFISVDLGLAFSRSLAARHYSTVSSVCRPNQPHCLGDDPTLTSGTLTPRPPRWIVGLFAANTDLNSLTHPQTFSQGLFPEPGTTSEGARDKWSRSGSWMSSKLYAVGAAAERQGRKNQ